ncbi:ABC transporter substrate-binding protein [Microbacterium awajiense]|uniref:ABC transporter substrate-binding protein n=1 Tax=Microbacterium awajiense TaxID=415214 RepID=A0ABP7AW96_9MICO
MSRSGRSATTAIAIAASVALLASLGGCAAGAHGADGGVYRVPISAPGSQIDPLTASDQYALAITGLVTEPLASLDADGVLHPRLATQWSASADGLTWTVELRPEARFNDGEPVTATDVVWTFESIIDEESPSPGQTSFAGVLEAIEATDELSVDFVLSRPFSDFPLLFTGPNTGILPDGYTPGSWLEEPVGAGQFLLTDYTIGQGATYVKNPDYWNADEILLDGVELKIYADAQAQLLAFQAGDIDRIGLTAEVASTIDLADYDVISSGFNRFDALVFDVTAPPFDDETARQAVAWAIDRPALIEAVYFGNADVANDTTFFPDYEPKPQGLQQRTQDLDRVEELRAGRTFRFTITTSYQLLGEVIQQQLNAVPGFDVSLDVMTTEEYYADGDVVPWLQAPVTATSWAKRAPTQYLAAMYAAGSDWNASHYDNPELEELAAGFDATTDPVQRQALVDEIGRIQWSEVPAIIPAYSKSQAVQSTRVEGEFAGPLDFYTGYDFSGISVER